MKANLPRISESEFMAQVIAYAKLRRWRVAHFRAARTERGWRTPVQGDGKGFPDLVLVRERVLWLELKTEKGKTSQEQNEWLSSLESAHQTVYIVRPSDWNAIERLLH